MPELDRVSLWRQRAADQKRLNHRRPRVEERSWALQDVLANDASTPFDAPPLPPRAAAPPAPAEQRNDPVPSQMQPQPVVTTQMYCVPEIRNVRHGHANEPSPGSLNLPNPATSAALPMSEGSSSKALHQPRALPNQKFTGKRRKVHDRLCLGGTYHPNLPGFRFPQTPAPVPQASQATCANGIELVNLTGDISDAEDDSPTPSAKSRDFNFHRRDISHDTDAEGEDDPDFTPFHNIVPFIKAGQHNVTTHQKTTAPRNVIPNLEQLFEQWFLYGNMYYQGLRLLQPRDIPINSVTARTLPCGTISPPGLEKSTVLLTICSGYDVAEIKMFEAEIATNSGKGLDIDHGIYHETSTSNPNIWTVLFIREKPQLVPTGNVRGPGMPNGMTHGGGPHVAKKRRGQGPDVGTATGGATVQHPWQIIAWPSAHVTKFKETLGPEREALSNDKVDKMSRSRPCLGREPLAPIYQVRLQPPRNVRFHLGDSRAYAKYKARGRLRTKRQICGYRDIQVIGQENVGVRPQARRLSTKVNTTEGHWRVCYFDNQDIEVGNFDNDIVSVHEGQRLTCLRFYRGGKIPLLAGKGVDLTYWKTFCDYFSKGELQLEFLCPARAEPIILSEEEQLRRRGKGKTNHPKANNNDRHTGASQTGHTANTPTPTGNIGVSLLPMASALHLRTNSLPHFGSAVAYQVLPRSHSAGNNPYPYRQLPRRKVAVMRGWQAEMLSALGQERNPKWAGWTDRSPLHLKRKSMTEQWEKQQIEWAVHSKDRARYILHAEPRACRDYGTMVADYFKGAERELNRVEKKVAAKFRSEGLNEEEERARLRQNEMLLAPHEHLRDVRATATKRAEARRRYRPDQRYQQTYMEAYHQQQQQAYYYQQAYHQQHAWCHQQAYLQQQQHINHQQQHQVYPQFADPGLAFPSVSGSAVGQQGGQHVQAFWQNGQQGGN